MLEILNASIAFPTVIFTGLLICALIFWGSVLLTGVDPQALDPDADAHVDTGDVHLDAHVDADVDAHVDADVDGDVDGDVAGDVDGDADADTDADTDANADHHIETYQGAEAISGGSGVIGSLMGFMNIGTVPVSMVATAVIFASWVLCMMLTLYTKPTLESFLPAFVVVTLFLVGSLTGGCIAGSLATRPMRKLFRVTTQHGGRALIEKFCTITTDHVNEKFGEASLKTHDSPLLLSVRCPHENKLKKGRLAVIVAYAKANNTYQVAELPEESEKIVRVTLDPETESDLSKGREAVAENES
jgi:hypothetical protein